MPAIFESCEPAIYVKSAYPKLVADYEELLNAKVKPKRAKATTVKKPKSVAAEVQHQPEQQPAITQFFTQNKAAVPKKNTKPIENLESKKDKKVIQIKIEVPKVPNIVSEVKKSDVLPPPPSPIVFHKNVLKLREQSIVSNMSVDITEDSMGSDLSMIIDDFIKKPNVAEKVKAPNLSDPISTSTPRIRLTRESLQEKENVFQSKKFPTNVLNVASKKDCIAVNKSEISMMELNETLPKLDQILSTKKVEKVVSSNKLIEKDHSRMLIDETGEDSFDRMCQ